MQIRTLLQPLQVAALLLTAVNPGQSQDAADVERSTHLRYGQANGFQEVRHNADGSTSVHFEYNNKGRGPKFDAKYTPAADGTLLQVDSEGVDELKAPISDHFVYSDIVRDAAVEPVKPGSDFRAVLQQSVAQHTPAWKTAYEAGRANAH
jgi:hypothetical protein